ncbi:unnamed protein product [Trichobilharzia szidati]|nr:unnamed protein product [Trichobilharzia szidati]
MRNNPGISFTLQRLTSGLYDPSFVAHPHCQHLLTTLWYDQLPGWRKRHPFTKLFLCFCFIIALPILAPTYLIHPHGCVGQLMRSPLIKFINHSASFAIFIFLLLIASTDTLTQTDLQIRSEIRGPDPNVIEMLILWWVIGFVWSEMKQIWEEGLKAYVRQWWNWLDFLMLGLYLTTVALRVVAVLLRKTNQYGTESLPRNQWPPTDPTLLSEALFSIAHIFSFARIIFLFQINEHLGPLQISLGNMLIDITKFIFIFLLVISSFACGLHQLYYYYLSNDEDNRPRAFSSLVSSYRTLFWHLFGSSQGGNFEVTFVNKTTGERERMESARNTMVVGEILLLIYHAMAIIVLVNMLIAMMSNSFQTIQNHADTEWKFARSKLWVGYFDEGSTLPPPLNTIISPKSIIRFLCGIYHLIVLLIKSCRNCKLQTSDSNHSGGNHRQNIEFRKETKLSSMNSQSSQKSSQLEWDIEIQETGTTRETLPNTNIMNKQKQHSMKEIKQSKRKTYYQTVMRRLVRRYIHQSKKTMRQDGVNEDDLLEIKQDISSLRFELREDRKREIVRAVCQLETLKQELVDELGKQSTILQNATIHPQTSPTTMPTTSTIQTSMITSSPSSSSYPRDELTDYRRKLYKTKPSIPTSVIDSSEQANIHYSTTNINTGQKQLQQQPHHHHLQSTSSDSKIKEGGRKKYSLNYDKESKDIYKDLMQLASINDIPIDVLKLNERNNRIATKGLYIDDWNQFKNEMKNELKEELSALLNNRSVVLDNQQLISNTSNSNNNNNSYQNISSTPSENRSNIIQSTNQTKYSSRKTSDIVNTTHSSNILRKYSKQSDSSVNPNNNSRVNINDRLKLLHTRYSENVIIDLASSTPVTGVSDCSTSVLPALKTTEGIVASTPPVDTMMSSSSSHENRMMKSIMNTSTRSTVLSGGNGSNSSGSMNSKSRRQIIDLVGNEQKNISTPENYATSSEDVEKS